MKRKTSNENTEFQGKLIKTESPITNVKINSSNTPNEWKATAIFRSCYRQFPYEENDGLNLAN